MYFEITANSGVVAKDIEEEIYKISKHPQQIRLIGNKLGKTQTEINKRLNELNPPLESNKKEETPQNKSGFFKKLFG